MEVAREAAANAGANEGWWPREKVFDPNQPSHL